MLTFVVGVFCTPYIHINTYTKCLHTDSAISKEINTYMCVLWISGDEKVRENVRVKWWKKITKITNKKAHSVNMRKGFGVIITYSMGHSLFYLLKHLQNEMFSFGIKTIVPKCVHFFFLSFFISYQNDNGNECTT